MAVGALDATPPRVCASSLPTRSATAPTTPAPEAYGREVRRRVVAKSLDLSTCNARHTAQLAAVKFDCAIQLAATNVKINAAFKAQCVVLHKWNLALVHKELMRRATVMEATDDIAAPPRLLSAVPKGESTTATKMPTMAASVARLAEQIVRARACIASTVQVATCKK